MTLFEKILSRDEFVERPPVLLDVGAAGAIHPKWRDLAPYSICIAFDADDREMGYTVNESSGYLKLYVYNCIVTAEEEQERTFYLTRSPQCSSLLPPDTDALGQWEFAPLFEVERAVRLKTVTLPQVLGELGVDRIDWFKTDSQGTDLRLFRSLGEERIERVLAAEFEPGIIDAYRGEDKLWSLFAFMEEKPFWMADLAVKGTQRFNHRVLTDELSGLDREIYRRAGKVSPGWGEVAFLNTFAGAAAHLDRRDYMLGWIFASVEKQYGFALELAVTGYGKFEDPIFVEMKRKSLRQIGALGAAVPVKRLMGLLQRLASRLGVSP